MEKSSASELAAAWLQAHEGSEQEGANALYPFLRTELMGLLPDEGTFGVGRPNGGEPAVMGVWGGSLVLVAASSRAEAEGAAPGDVLFRVDRRPLDPRSSPVALEARIDQTAIRHRSWTFWPNDGWAPVRLQTREALRPRLGDDSSPSPDELVARAIARSVGWPVPEEDPSRPHDA